MDLSRQKDLVDAKIFDTPTLVIGCGGIGSFTTLALAKMGFKDINVMDDDAVEEHNLPNQFYPLASVGAPKVEALRDMVLNMTGTGIGIHQQRWGRASRLDPTVDKQWLVISAVDSMLARKHIYESVQTAHCILIDGRMGAQQLEVRTCELGNRVSMEAFKRTLWTDAEAAAVPCTARAVMYNVLMIASLIGNQARLALEKKPYHREIIYDFETGTHLTQG